jgi:hypothetical protein
MLSTASKADWRGISGKLAACCAIALLIAGLALAQATSDEKKQKSDNSLTTKIRIVITGGEKDQPIAGASIYVRFTETRFLHKDKLVEMNLKTNLEGAVKVPEIPRGKTEIQVIALGWKTYGKWYDVQNEEETIKIKLVRPTKWY